MPVGLADGLGELDALKEELVLDLLEHVRTGCLHVVLLVAQQAHPCPARAVPSPGDSGS